MFINSHRTLIKSTNNDTKQISNQPRLIITHHHNPHGSCEALYKVYLGVGHEQKVLQTA